MGKDQLLPGYQILCTGVTQQEKDIITDLVARHGAQLLTAASARNPAHIVITRNVRSYKYREMMKIDPTIPVVKPAWLIKSHQAGRLVDKETYRVKALYNLNICFSGLDPDLKKQLAQKVELFQGRHSAALDKSCSHLITNTTASAKYEFAVSENIPAVSVDWLEACINLGWYQDTRKYPVADIPPQEAMNGGNGNAAATGNRGTTTLTMMMDTEATIFSKGNTLLQQHHRQHSINEWPHQDPSALVNETMMEDDNVYLNGPSLHHHTAAELGANDDDDYYDDLDGDDTAVFLDRVKLWLTGQAPKERLEALRLCREGAAKRFEDPHHSITHIVIGSDITATEAATVLDCVSRNVDISVVGMDWLRRCCTRKVCLPADDRFKIPLATLQGVRKKKYQNGTGGSDMYHNNNEGTADKYNINNDMHSNGLMINDSWGSGGGVGGGQDEDLGLASNAGKQQQDNNNGKLSSRQQISRAPSKSSATATGVFTGCYFTLTALEKGSPQEAEAKKLIQAGHGRLFHGATVKAVSNQSKAYAICPPSLTPSQVAQLRSTCPDIKTVDECNRFTLYWLESCLEAGQLLPPMRGAPCYQPLPHSLPLPGMDQVVVCVSGFSAAVRTAIARTVSIVGGKVTLEAMTRKNTHLICAEAKGTKFDHCGPFGVMPVVADWLVDSIETGRLQPEENYKPRLPAAMNIATIGGAVNAGVKPSSIVVAVGATQGGVTAGLGIPPIMPINEIGATQMITSTLGLPATAAFAGGGGSSSLLPSLFQAVMKDVKATAPSVPVATGICLAPSQHNMARPSIRQRIAALGGGGGSSLPSQQKSQSLLYHPNHELGGGDTDLDSLLEDLHRPPPLTNQSLRTTEELPTGNPLASITAARNRSHESRQQDPHTNSNNNNNISDLVDTIGGLVGRLAADEHSMDQGLTGSQHQDDEHLPIANGGREGTRKRKARGSGSSNPNTNKEACNNNDDNNGDDNAIAPLEVKPSTRSRSRLGRGLHSSSCGALEMSQRVGWDDEGDREGVVGAGLGLGEEVSAAGDAAVKQRLRQMSRTRSGKVVQQTDILGDLNSN
jgi:hypothetical protein